MYAVFDSDSEYERLLLIQTPISYKLNPTTLGTLTWQNGMTVEVIGMTKRLRIVEKSSVSSSTKREGKISKRKGRGDNLLISVVDETMRQVFREAGAKVIYDYLENNSHLKLEEIAEKPEVFSLGLKRLLSSATPMIEKLILKNLYSKLELKFEEKEDYEFSDYIRELRGKCGC